MFCSSQTQTSRVFFARFVSATIRQIIISLKRIAEQYFITVLLPILSALPTTNYVAFCIQTVAVVQWLVRWIPTAHYLGTIPLASQWQTSGWYNLAVRNRR